MKKLLHERLRETESNLTLLGGYYIYLTNDQKKELANEIERYYIPRPRFEDGEPACWKDELANGEPLFTITYDHAGVISINAETVNPEYELVEDQALTRPLPKVLDADGVEIKVGDTVWRTDPPIHPSQVVDIKHYPEGQPEVVCSEKNGQVIAHYSPNLLTHKEPDSIKNLLDDIADWGFSKYDEASRRVAQSFIDRFFALNERGA